ncbi:MAG: hypothetical protein AB1806_03040 [Acidobacteriota bacterium]
MTAGRVSTLARLPAGVPAEQLIEGKGAAPVKKQGSPPGCARLRAGMN